MPFCKENSICHSKPNVSLQLYCKAAGNERACDTGPVSMMFETSCLFASLRLETGIFEGRPADYLFMLLFNWLLSIIVALFMQIPFIMDPMVSHSQQIRN